MIDQTLDARGLKCPLPVLLAKKALKAAPKGSLLEILATDRGVDADFVDLCELTGAVLIEFVLCRRRLPLRSARRCINRACRAYKQVPHKKYTICEYCIQCDA